MQKKLIAMAVAGLVAAPAFAQSNVTVYGILDAAVAYGKAGDAKYTGLQNAVLSGNRFGLKGSEDLGNGLKAVFTLEHHFSIGNGNNAGGDNFQFQRQSWAGLKGSFGTIALGRQYAPGYLWTARITNALGAGAYEPQADLGFSRGLTITPGSGARWNNSISYDSGNMGGLNVRAVYAFMDTQTETGAAGAAEASDDDRIGLGVAYNAGPLKVGVVYHNLSGTAEDTDEVYLAGSYNLGVATINASVQTGKRDANAGAGVSELDVMIYTLGAVVPVGAGNIHFAVGQLKDDAVDDADATSVSLGYTQSLSKRTNVTVALNSTRNDDNSAAGVLLHAAGETSNSIAAGLRHKF